MSVAVAVPPPLAADADACRGRALLVEDDHVTRKIVARMLRRCSFDVREVSNGKEAYDALRKADEEDAQYDLVLSDHNMPEMTGLELLAKFDEMYRHSSPAGEGAPRPAGAEGAPAEGAAAAGPALDEDRATSSKPRPAFVMMSSQCDQAKVRRSEALGALRFLSKPVAAADLQKVFAQLAAGGMDTRAVAEAAAAAGVEMVPIKRCHSSEDVTVSLPLAVSRLAPTSAIDAAAPTAGRGAFHAFTQPKPVVSGPPPMGAPQALTAEQVAALVCYHQQQSKQRNHAQPQAPVGHLQQQQQRAGACSTGTASASTAPSSACAGPFMARISCNPVPQSQRRAVALEKYRQKRKTRCWDKKVRYESRQRVAVNRPRVTGRFAKRSGSDSDTTDVTPAPAEAAATAGPEPATKE